MSKNNIDIYDIAPSIEDILKENQQLRIDLKDKSYKIIQLEKIVCKKVEELVNEEHRSKELYDKNIELKQENQELKAKLGRSLPRVVIRNTLDNVLPSLEEENEKLKQAIKFLKDNFPIKFLGYNKYGAKPYEIMFNGFITGFDKEPYDLLKQVFESVGGSDE